MPLTTNQHAKQFAQWYGAAAHPVLEKNFSPAEVHSLFEQDLQAGKTVPMILTSVIVAGVLLAIISVLFV